MKSLALKTWQKLIFLELLSVLVFVACTQTKAQNNDIALLSENTVEEIIPEAKPIGKEFKDYWYAGEAEITSYQLEQARYGEIREGKAVMIFVTEDFLPERQVKADNYGKSNVSVLKLNATKKFNTGIYPYSIMSSVFYPVANNAHAIKVSSSMQEWCGHVYAQLNNREEFEIMSHSYFEGEEDKSYNLNKSILENELWNKIRIAPETLPTGEIEVIPSFEFTRLRHVEVKAYPAKATLKNNGGTAVYSLSYPALDRELKITFNKDFPYEIQSWEETFKSGFGPNAKVLTTKATKIKSIKSPYWKKNHNKDEVLRDELGL